MKKFLLLSALAVSGLTMMAQDENTVAVTYGGDDGMMVKSSSGATVPMNWYFYNWDNQMIYSASQLSGAGMTNGNQIKSLTFYGSYIGAQENKVHGAYTVFMTETEASNYTSAQPIEMGADTQVAYVENYALPQVGTDTENEPLVGLNLDTPYTYNGGNLLIKIEYRSPNVWDSGCYLYGYSEYSDQVIFRGKDNLDAMLSSAWSAGTILPKVTFTCETTGVGVKNVADTAAHMSVKGGVINTEGVADINVHNTNGVNVARANGSSLDINNLPAGVYIVNVRGDQGVSTMRIVK